MMLIAAVLFFACGEGVYIGGDCEDKDDCDTPAQKIPGTICVDGRCVCLDPGEVICCERGAEGPNCSLACRPCRECAAGTPACAWLPRSCEVDADCPDPPDPRCGVRQCVDGFCRMEILTTQIASQIRGDCKVEQCTLDGHVISMLAIDPYDDGNECTLDVCAIDTPIHLRMHGVECPESGAGRCYHGECVQCVDADSTFVFLCPGGMACDGFLCVPEHCVNGTRDPGLGETGFNCGGPCRPCQPGDRCTTAADCVSGVCTNGSCQIPTCTDGVKNGDETGIDCGAPSCPRCEPGRGCKTHADCTSGVCWRGVCEAPTCTDGVKNGDETGVDCGGEGCELPCPDE